MPEPRERDEARLDELRRRLYAPTATEEDRRRYAALQAELLTDAAPPGDDAATDPPRPRRRRRALLAAIGVAAAVVIAAAAIGSITSRRASSAAHTAAATAPTSATEPLQGGEHYLAVDGGSAPTPFPVDVDGTAAVGEQSHGFGDQTVPIDTSSAPQHGGRLVVVLTAGRADPIGWRAVRLRFGAHGAVDDQVVAAGAPVDRTRPGGTEISDYTGSPPIQLRVTAPHGTTWTATVALIGPAVQLH